MARARRRPVPPHPSLGVLPERFPEREAGRAKRALEVEWDALIATLAVGGAAGL